MPKMDFTLGLITGAYAVLAVIIFYIVYVIEVKLDLPAIVNGQSTHTQAASIQHNDNSSTEQQQDFSNISQTRLRQLIEAIIAETLTHVPALSTSGAVSEIALDTRCNGATPLTNGVGPAQRHRTEHYFEPTVYQDLLATAVLNKIVDKQSHSNRRFSESTPDLSGRNIDPNYHEENRSTSSGSSVEPRSDCSYTDTEHILNIGKGENEISPCDSRQNLHADDRPLRLIAGRESALSDYIASHMVPLPDLSAPPTESEEEDYLSVNSSAFGEGTWEDNWLFKKKRGADLKSSVGANSVGMLVPAPKEDVRAQIGDKTADEVSDLSEMGSDTDDSSLDLLRNNELDPLNDRLLNKHLIGGQNTKMVLDELIERTSMISHTSLAENEPVLTETKNEGVLNAAAKAEAIEAINSNFEQIQAETHSHAEQTMEETDGSTTPNPLAAQNLFENVGNSNEASQAIENPSSDMPSVMEILAAIALGPMLAVPAAVTTLTHIEEIAHLTELSHIELPDITFCEIHETPHDEADDSTDCETHYNNNVDLETQAILELDLLDSESIADSVSTDIITEKSNDSEISSTSSLSELAVSTTNQNVTTNIKTTNTTTETIITNVDIEIDADKNVNKAAREDDISPETDIVAEKAKESEMPNTCTLSETDVNITAEHVATIINPTNTNTNNQAILTNVELKVDAEKNLDIAAHAEKDVSPEIVEVEDDVTLRRHFLPGSIAEREYMKWNNAVEMPNNPYAPEALKKRISGSRDCFMDLPNISPSKELNPVTLIQEAKEADTTNELANREIEVQRYSRDYYINEARQNGATIPKHQTSVEANCVTMNGSNHNSDEPAIDHITINESLRRDSIKNRRLPAKAIVTALPQPETQTSLETANETSTLATEELYQALPAQVVEEEHPPSSIETHSHQSLQSVQSVHTSSSDESDTVRVYDFKKQETIKIRDAAKRGRAVSMEAMGTAVEPVAHKERPGDLQFKRASSADGLRARSPVKPNRGSTPTALRFLQPKRKLIEPSQVLAQHCTDEPQEQTPAEPLERAVIEQDVVLSLPSVKALARAFLEQSNEAPKQLKCWRVKTKLTPEILKHFTPIVPSKNFETSPAPIAATANRSTSSTFKSEQIISNNNNNNNNVSVEETKDNTTNSTHQSSSASTTPTTTTTAHTIIPTGKMSPIPMLPEGFLKGNIAFFENLKSK